MLVTQKLLETLITDHSSKTIQHEDIDMFVPNLKVIYKTFPLPHHSAVQRFMPLSRQATFERRAWEALEWCGPPS